MKKGTLSSIHAAGRCPINNYGRDNLTTLEESIGCYLTGVGIKYFARPEEESIIPSGEGSRGGKKSRLTIGADVETSP